MSQSQPSKTTPALRKVEDALKRHALSYPQAEEAMPWGHLAVKVKGKAFLFMGVDEHGALGLSTKLPQSHGAALMFPFAEPTGYGLGKSGWVSASFKPKETPPLELMKQWIDESYRAVAPKKLVASLDAPAEAVAPTPRARGKGPRTAARAKPTGVKQKRKR